MRFKPFRLLRKMMPDLVWKIPDTAPGDVFLTFDDGPTPGITEWILAELARFDMKATFFVLGKNVEQYPHQYRLILEAGHAVGNHTWNHPKGWGTTVKSYLRNVERAAALVRSDMFRPPYGRISTLKARLLAGRYKIVMWNIISRDYNRRVSRKRCLENVTKHVRPGDIVVFHDSEKAFKNLLFALPHTLKFLHEHGLKSKAIRL